jgi:hypothetical protein
MRKSVVSLVVLGLVFVVFSATASAATKARPFQGYMIGTATFTPGTATDPSPTGVWARPYGVGDVSHLGASVMTAKHPADLTFKDGDMTLVAANGDKVFMKYSGGGPAPQYLGQVYDIGIKFTIVGGTGRFTGATGGGDMTVTLTFKGFDLSTGSVVWPETVVWRNGTIRY